MSFFTPMQRKIILIVLPMVSLCLYFIATSSGLFAASIIMLYILKGVLVAYIIASLAFFVLLLTAPSNNRRDYLLISVGSVLVILGVLKELVFA